MDKNRWIAIAGVVLIIGVVAGTFIKSLWVANALLMAGVLCFAYACMKDRKNKNTKNKKQE